MIDIGKVRNAVEYMNYGYGEYFGDREKDLVEQAINELERLQEKEKPMKPVIKIIYGGTSGMNYEQYLCPNCNHGSIFIGNYNDKVTHCFSCGQKLDWSETE